MKGENERLLYEILNDAYPGQWESDKKLIDEKKFRGDAIHREKKIVIEIDGGMYPFYAKRKDGTLFMVNRGGHSTAAGIQRDMDKSNIAQLSGWIFLRYTPMILKISPVKIITDVWHILGKPTGKSIPQIEAALIKKDKNKKRECISRVEGQTKL